jgi:hypothetical protein
MTTSTPPEDQLTERLHRLTDTIDGPVPTAAVVRRGRAAVRRKRVIGTAAALSVFTAAGVLSVTSGLLSHPEDRERLAGPATSPSASSTPTHGKTNGKKDDQKPSKTSRASTTWCNGGTRAYQARLRRYGPTLATYRDLVAEHLDPQQQHLQKEVTGGDINTAKGCVLDALGTKLGWTNAGEDGLGMVVVEVTTDWRTAQTNLAHGGWHPASSLPAGAARAYVADYQGGTAVAVTRSDGTTVALDAARLFGNNSVTPVTSMDVTTDELLATAADPRFQLP